jgi:hypothetical protein
MSVRNYDPFSRLAIWAVILCAGWAFNSGVAQAQEPPAEESESADEPVMSQTLELGTNIRTDFGVHVLRLDLAWTTDRVRALVVVDPLFWLDGKSSTDLLAMWRTERFEPFVGWRLNRIRLLDGSQSQHNLVIGTALRFPDFLGGRVGGQWGIEMATMLYKHGGGVAANRIRLDSGRHYIDLVNFGMFARFHYNLEIR